MRKFGRKLDKALGNISHLKSEDPAKRKAKENEYKQALGLQEASEEETREEQKQSTVDQPSVSSSPSSANFSSSVGSPPSTISIAPDSSGSISLTERAKIEGIQSIAFTYLSTNPSKSSTIIPTLSKSHDSAATLAKSLINVNPALSNLILEYFATVKAGNTGELQSVVFSYLSTYTSDSQPILKVLGTEHATAIELAEDLTPLGLQGLTEDMVDYFAG